MTRLFKLYGPHAEPASPFHSLPSEIATSQGNFAVQRHRIDTGPGAGVEMIRVSGRRAGFIVLPTRGMGIWRAWAGQVPFGWRSPVQGPIHPSLVPLFDPSGVGWLEGFDELLVRCGLDSNGAPEFDQHQRLRYPLHGRIANLPAESLEVSVDDRAGTIAISGVVRQARLFFAHLTLRSTTRMQVDGESIEIVDEVTNQSDQNAVHQMLYHINVGAPVLGEGARLVVPPSEVVPKTPRAADGIDDYPIYGPPEIGFAEQVYLMRMQHDHDGWTRALLRAADGSAGFGLRYDAATLPYFVQWKNTGGERDGYVTGLEPSTNFPNTRSFEEDHGRVVHLGPGETITYRMHLHLLSGRDHVEAFSDEVRKLARHAPTIARQPREGWCQS